LNTKETLESVKHAVEFWNDCYDSGGTSWDDAGNNRAFLASTISSTQNGASIYLLAKAMADTYLTETGKPVQGRHISRAVAARSSRPFQLSRAVLEHHPRLFKELGGREGLPALVSLEGDL
jgi:hypothetical protein